MAIVKHFVRVFLCVLVALVPFESPAHAQDLVADFYRGCPASALMEQIKGFA